MSKVITTEKIKLEFITAAGKDYSFSLENPNKELTEAEVLEQAQAIIDANVVMVDGEALTTVSDISIIKTEKTVYDLNAE